VWNGIACRKINMGQHKFPQMGERIVCSYKSVELCSVPSFPSLIKYSLCSISPGRSSFARLLQLVFCKLYCSWVLMRIFSLRVSRRSMDSARSCT